MLVKLDHVGQISHLGHLVGVGALLSLDKYGLTSNTYLVQQPRAREFFAYNLCNLRQHQD